MVRKRPRPAIVGAPGERELGWLRFFASSTNDVFWDWDLESGSVRWYESATAIFGFGEKQAQREWFSRRVHPDDGDRVRSEVDARLGGREDRWTIQFRFERASGDYISVLSRAVIVRNPGGRANRVLGTLQSEPSASQLLRAQDDERRRIARELHDVTGQKIAALQLNLFHTSQTLSDLPPEARAKLNECIDLAENCLREIRTVSYLLHPPLLDELGLEHALDTYLQGFGLRSGVRATLDYDPRLGRLPSEWELALYRIVQEGLSNLHRHSGSKTAQLCVRRLRKELVLTLTDQGRGLRNGRARRSGTASFSPGMGITGMQERARAVGGEFQITSDARGTVMTVKIPLPKTAD